MSKVSIIVPVYNTEKYLHKCLTSIVNQTLKEIQIIIVNDGSTDNSKIIIEEFQNQYPDNIMVLEKENGGLSDSRNFALPYVLGEYVGFVDSDDYIEPTMFEKMYRLAKEKNLDLVECNFIWEFAKKQKNDYGKRYIKNNDFFIYGRVMVCNKLFKSAIIKENRITFPVSLRYEDIEFFYKLVPYIKKSDLINLPFYHYIQRENSIINNQTEKNIDIFTILNNLIKFYQENNFYNKYKEQLEYLYIRFLLGSSFLRIIKVKDKYIKKRLLDKTINELYIQFPKWKKNQLLKKRSKKNFYYRTINKFTFKIYSFLFSIL